MSFGTVALACIMWAGPAACTPLVACGLPGAIAPGARRNVTIDGVSMPFGVLPLDWASARVLAHIAGILAAEVLGYVTVNRPPRLSSIGGLSDLAGCKDTFDSTCEVQPAPRAHATFETWDTTTSTYEDQMRDTLGSRMPENVGQIGYEGFEGMFLSKEVMDVAMKEHGLPLEYYKSYNASWHSPGRFFSNFTNIPVDGLQPCSKTKFYLPIYVNKYLEVSGDYDGVEVVDGTTVAKCIGGASGHWWMSPACRSAPDTCIPVIDAGDGWALDSFMQRAAVHSMPVAIAVGTWGAYTQIPKAFKTLFFSWQPDTTFIEILPMDVMFPPSEWSDWANGVKTTDSSRSGVSKWAHASLADEEPRLQRMLRQMRITQPQMRSMLMKTSLGQSESDIACEWLKANPDIWADWITSDTACGAGWGLVDLGGNYVLNRSTAKSCARCGRGHASTALVDGVGETRTCSPCEPGYAQGNSAQSECLPCEPGLFADGPGRYTCRPCPAGSASDALGMSACAACRPGNYQPVVGSTACASCAGGSFQAEEGATTCDSCQSGTFSVAGAEICQNCSAGTVSRAGGSSTCEACSPGSTAGAPGLSECVPCSVGTYAASPGLSACVACGGGAPSWSTMRHLIVNGVERWVVTDAARSPDDCGCDEGARFDKAGRCMPCQDEEGILCPGMGDVLLLPGYYSPQNLSVYRCTDDLRCPGGPPGGTCAPGRVSRACSRCDVGLRPSATGGCEPCGMGGEAPAIIACIVAMVLCLALYGVFEASDSSDMGFRASPFSVSGGLLLGLLQQLSVLGLLNNQYEEPLHSFFMLLQVFAFDVEELLRVDCLGEMSPSTHFGLKTLSIAAATATISIAHVVCVVVRHRGAFRERSHVLVSALATVGLALNTSVVVTVLQPLQCKQNPNGLWTVGAYKDVICWSSDDGEHGGLLAIAFAALLLPMALLAFIVYLVVRHPRATRSGDVGFMRYSSFLMFRFRPNAQWYALAVMSRSLLVGLVPVVPFAAAQLYILLAVLLGFFSLVVWYRPWRVSWLNWADTFFSALMLEFVYIAAIVIKIHEGDAEPLCWICLVATVACLLFLPLRLLVEVARRVFADRRRYKYFLCHAKADAGAFARWFKVELVAHTGAPDSVFLDADDLDSLDHLLAIVAGEITTLVVVGTRSVYSRPWCVGEMCTAHRNHVAKVVIALRGFQPPTEEAINDIAESFSCEVCLTENGISGKLVRDALTAFSAHPALGATDRITATAMHGLVKSLERGQDLTIPVYTSESIGACKLAIVADVADSEANAAAYVLRALLMSQSALGLDSVPHVLGENKELPDRVEAVIFVFTTECFAREHFVLSLVAAAGADVERCAVIADNDFTPPDQDALIHKMRDLPCCARTAALLVLELLSDRAVTINAKRATMKVLEATASRICSGLESSRRNRSQNRSRGSLVRRLSFSLKSTSTGSSDEPAASSDEPAGACERAVDQEEVPDDEEEVPDDEEERGMTPEHSV